MLDWLSEQQIKGGPVAQPSKKHHCIVVYGMRQKDIVKLPSVFNGFAVEGRTDTPDYSRGQWRQM